MLTRSPATRPWFTAPTVTAASPVATAPCARRARPAAAPPMRSTECDDRERRAHGTFGVVLVSGRRAPHGHHRVADELLQRPAMGGHDRSSDLEVACLHGAHFLGVHRLGEGGEVDEIDEEHGYPPPLRPTDRVRFARDGWLRRGSRRGVLGDVASTRGAEATACDQGCAAAGTAAVREPRAAVDAEPGAVGDRRTAGRTALGGGG